DPAPCGGRRRARSFLFVARPRVGRRRSKVLAKILGLWRVDWWMEEPRQDPGLPSGATKDRPFRPFRRSGESPISPREKKCVETSVKHRRNVVARRTFATSAERWSNRPDRPGRQPEAGFGSDTS